MSLPSFLLLSAGGFVAGAFGTLLGLGGGLFLVPFLVLLADIPMHQAIATSIIAVIATSSTGASIYLQRGLVNIKLGMLLEVATVVGAIGGGVTASLLSAELLTKLFSLVMVIAAGIMILRMRSGPSGATAEIGGLFPAEFTDEGTNEVVHYTARRIPGTMTISLIAGNLSGLLGIGGGIFKVPAMHVLSGVPLKAATATSNFMIGVTATASAFIYFANGHLNPAVASSATLGVLCGSVVGTYLSKQLHRHTLGWVFIVVLIAVSVHMFLR
jgi:uncharacterized membrane protein YfcA